MKVLNLAVKTVGDSAVLKVDMKAEMMAAQKGSMWVVRRAGLRVELRAASKAAWLGVMKVGMTEMT